jgi:colanic acid/amylovoran biosynthesis protein
MQGVPAVTVATQGKVEGLMDLFGTPGLCVPADALANSLARVAGETADAAEHLSVIITERLDAVADLAGRNFAGLSQAVRAVTSG